MKSRWYARANANTRSGGREAPRSLRPKRLANMTRAQLINVVGEKGQGSLGRTTLIGKVELYGFFTDGEDLAGWIMAIVSANHEVRFAIVSESVETRRSWVSELNKVPWRLWAGDQVSKSDINLGDNPARYKAWKFQDEQIEKTVKEHERSRRHDPNSFGPSP